LVVVIFIHNVMQQECSLELCAIIHIAKQQECSLGHSVLFIT
jgi:hypothetical protein